MLISLNGLNTTEVEYTKFHPSVDEQMLLFHTGPMDIVPDNIDTTKEAGHKQQNIEATTLPSVGTQGSKCLDPDEPCQRLGDLEPGESAPRDEDRFRVLVPFAVGVLAGAAACWLASRRR